MNTTDISRGKNNPISQLAFKENVSTREIDIKRVFQLINSSRNTHEIAEILCKQIYQISGRFTELKKEGISTAVDTSGVFYLTPGIKEVIELTDLFLLDIKCINDEICRDLTGVSNQKELEFARYLSENGKHMWIRQVLVPGYTDKEEDLIKLKEFLATLKTVDKVEILPYHDMGRFKWEQLGLEYPLDGVRVANNEDVERAKKILGI